MSQTTQITIPTDLAERLQKEAAAMGVDLPKYLSMVARLSGLDAKARDAARFVLSTQRDSLRKLAQ